MLGLEELKSKIEITETTVECPLKGCNAKVERQRDHFRKEDRFQCPIHRICISPSTFEYQSEEDNLLWTDEADLSLLQKIKTVKRESRIARDNSEDAVSWNVFRFLERNDLICDFLKNILGVADKTAEVIYWSYSQSQDGLLDTLKKGREEFELVPSKGSEPDIFIVGEKSLVLIEAKIGAPNRKPPEKEYVEDKYVSGGERWWKKVFHSSFRAVAIEERLYELSRFWLIGSWMANELGLDFHLVNLTLSEREKEIEDAFKSHIIENDSRRFSRITWEQISGFIENIGTVGHEKEAMMKYFRNKTMGYDGKGVLRRAFSLG